MKTKKSPAATSTVRFKATLHGASLIAPKTAKLPAGIETPVEGVIGALPFRGILAPTGKGQTAIEISPATRKLARVEDGAFADIEIIRIGDEAEARVPADLLKALKASPAALATWRDITPLARRDWVFWFVSAKQAETRRRHIEKAVDMLSHGKRRICCYGGANWLLKRR